MRKRHTIYDDRGDTMKQAVIYTRVSTMKQTDGISLDAQEARARSWCEATGHTIVGTFQDAGVSGAKMSRRDGLKDALDLAVKHGAALVVYSLSRLSRSISDTVAIGERLERAGADLVSLTESLDTTSAGGKMVFRLLAVFAEYERDLVSERTRTAMSFKRSQGQRVSGRLPFGYDLAPDGKTLEENPDEQKAIELILSLRRKGHTYRAICSQLESREIGTKTGAAWAPATVRGIVRRAA